MNPQSDRHQTDTHLILQKLKGVEDSIVPRLEDRLDKLMSIHALIIGLLVLTLVSIGVCSVL